MEGAGLGDQMGQTDQMEERDDSGCYLEPPCVEGVLLKTDQEGKAHPVQLLLDNHPLPVCVDKR